MKYLIVSIATDSDGTDTYIFNGSEEEMRNKVKAMCLDFCDEVGEDEYEFSCGYDNYKYQTYYANAQFYDYHFIVQAFKWEDIKKVSVSRKNLYKAKKIETEDYFEEKED